VLSALTLNGRDLQGADLQGAFLQKADLRGAKLQEAKLQGARLQEAKLREANLQRADLRGSDLRWANLFGADLSGANFEDAKNLDAAFLDLAFYCQDNPPNNLALSGVDAKQHPMALTRQEYDNVCRLRNSNNSSAFGQELRRLRVVCDSRQQVDRAVNAAKAKFEWCKPLVSTNLAIMFSQGFDATTRAARYGNGTVGKVLQGISHGLEFLNHLVGRGGR
jgi:hypothetical protein